MTMSFADTIRGWFSGADKTAVSPSGIPQTDEVGLDPSASGITSGDGAEVPEPPAPSRESRVPPDTALKGAAGTPIFYGFVRDLGEYNPKFAGRAAFRLYEQMRRSDADVAASLAACKFPIRAADWQVVPGLAESDPGFARAKEISAFVRENLFGGLESPTESGGKVSQSFESVLENALLCLDFGVAGYEDLWHVDGDRVRLRRLAPRLPLTFFRFHVEEDGETLDALEQWGYRGNNFVNVRVPATKIALFILNREGANFYGRSLLRSAYQHWYIKSQLYRIDAISCERNGMGIPWIEQGADASPADVKAAREWATRLSTHESVGLSLPPGWKLHLEGIAGGLREPTASIQHHSEMIARSVLAMFLSLGTSQTGSRALGNVLTDFFYLSLEATARMLAETITQTSIRRLVDYNFDPRLGTRGPGLGEGIPYPKLVCANIAVLNPLEMLEALKDVASANVDLLQPDDETEAYFRKKLGLPPKGKSPRVRFAPIVRRITEEESVGKTQKENGIFTAKTPRHEGEENESFEK